MTHRSLISTTLAAALLGLAACGGDDETDEFVAEADRICTDGVADIIALNEELGDPQSAEEDAEQTAQRVELQRQTTEELRAVEVPDDVASDYEEHLSLREQIAANEEEYGRLAEQGVPLEDPKVQQVDAEYYELLDQADAAAAAAGLQDCARELPTDLTESLSAEVEETLETGDPAFCTEKYTEEFVERTYGDLDTCQEEESKTGNSEPVTIEDVGGIEGVSAFVRFVPEKGPEAGTTLQVNLVYEDGTYKRNVIVPIPQAQ